MSATAPLSSRGRVCFHALAVRTQGVEIGLAFCRRRGRTKRP
jgi:hypothetical protein